MLHRARIPPSLSAPDRERDAGGLSRTSYYEGGACRHTDTGHGAKEFALAATFKRLLHKLAGRRLTGGDVWRSAALWETRGISRLVEVQSLHSELRAVNAASAIRNPVNSQGSEAILLIFEDHLEIALVDRFV